LIAIVACLGLAVDLTTHAATLAELEALDGKEAVLPYILAKMTYLQTSRPTAVNLANAMTELQTKLERATADRATLVQTVVDYADFMFARDGEDNRRLAEYGAAAILAKYPQLTKGGLTVLTICNTGSLATSHYGTALGVVRSLRAAGRLQQIVALETRPYNQGSRLTAYEMVTEDMPGATLICDSMAAAFMASRQVHAVVVGADRVCANGDTANKIGTYQLAVTAAAHDVPFYVAAPVTTLDPNLASGASIPIEERPAAELIESAKAPTNIAVWNPAFDVTPAKWITGGIITEEGVIHPQAGGTFDVEGFLAGVGGGEETKAASVPATPRLKVPVDYHEQSVTSMPSYLVKHAPEACVQLGTTNPDDLECKEVGDGNLNLVFIVVNTTDPDKQVIVKQALPYVRCVGESWPLTLERAYFEWTALSAEKEACPQFVPDLYHFSKANGLIVMEYLKPPIIILRKGLIAGVRYPTMASDMGTFCALTLFQTSGLALSTSEMRAKVEFWSRNRDMCALTEQVVFTEPYIEAPNNRWTSPQLDDEKKAIELDSALKLAAAGWKSKFVTLTQALIHADLHSGSVMCKPEAGQTFVIDPEFAFYGPAGFDTGAFVANLFLAYVSQEGHANGAGYADWILEQIATFWSTFVHGMRQQMMDTTQHKGFLFGREVFGDAEVATAQDIYMKDLLTDTLGFAGMKMLRRIVGIAHVEDLDAIADADARAVCEKHGLRVAKRLITGAADFGSMEEVIALARELK
jgi:5-methylthioribose kinase